MNNPCSPGTFHAFLETAFDKGDYATDDVIAFILPLFEEVLSFHETNLVAPFERKEALFITGQQIDIDEDFAHGPSSAEGKLKELSESLRSENFEITGKTRLDTNVDDGSMNSENLLVHWNTNEPLRFPAFIPGYSCFEILLNHHDAKTDIFCLGLVLGSISLGLDLYDQDDLKIFARYRSNPVQFNERIHPTISALITEMTELDRAQRCPDMYDVIHRLKHYRDYDPEKQTDLSAVAGWVNKELDQRSQFILSKLRNRLFDTTHRNRLLYYKPNMRFVNLTVSSVPMVLNYQSIRADLLFTWNSEIEGKVKDMKEIVLNKYLRFEDHAYLPSALDKIRLENRRDIQECGFSQLRLVIAFLNWHNLKENTKERIQSPLLLIPVELKKNKKLKEDHFLMKVLDNAAEVNPVLANQLRDLYGIHLPDFVDLDDMSLEQFYQLLKAQIDQANQGIQLKYIDKPRIKLVHSVAKQTVGNYKKRLRHTDTQLASYKNISYSYQQEHYKPLGLEIFRQRIEPKPSFLEFLVNDDIRLNTQQLTGSDTKERELFEMTESENNPYSWDFDICNIVLGNFNYKRMSLVRDYNQVIDNKTENAVFESLFSGQPKKYSPLPSDLKHLTDWNHVVAADPTQHQAILKSRSGESFIIQGPPGTGKSQTITNLVADFVARGKSILFVCEKRAALDVVYHRLKQNGLDELCCYIHDSQRDKREFIRDLKATYEDFTKNRMDLPGIKKQRTTLLQDLQKQMDLLECFHSTHAVLNTSAGMRLNQLINRVIGLRSAIIPMSATERELLPPYADWLSFGVYIEQLSDALVETGAEPAFAEHPFSRLPDTLLRADNPLNLLEKNIQRAKILLQQVEILLKKYTIAPEHSDGLKQLKSLMQDAVLLHPFAEHNNLSLVSPSNASAISFDEKVRQFRHLQKQLEEAKQKNLNWKTRLSIQDTAAARAIAEKNEGSFLSFLNTPWRKLKKSLQLSYDFSQHQVRPSYKIILQHLEEEYLADAAVGNARAGFEQQYHLANIETALLGIEILRRDKEDKEINYLLAHPDGNELIRQLYKLNSTLHELDACLQQCIREYDTIPVSELYDELESLLMNKDNLPDLLPALREFAQLPDGIKQLVRRLPLNPMQAEALMADHTLQNIYLSDRAFFSTDAAAIERIVKQIGLCHKRLLQLNSDLIRATIRERFLSSVDLGNTALSQLNNDQKQFKKNYNEGRRILENEFGKSMRYKSIRELSAKESGLVLKDIKPIWLMSPLSVSDSLPLDTGSFDVVIFDEASQITLEEGIPALYRAPQTIIVGDDKQMPPTNFFTSTAEDPDDMGDFGDEEDDELLSSDADSLLVQGVRKLDSTMLSWHYRSQHETLISFSNHAFYEGGLLTIPDKTIHHISKKGIEVTQPDKELQHASFLFDRSISFHYLPGSVYEKRSNLDEAAYIAQLVRTLLKQKIRESIGIVAFSQQQQHAVEDALTALAATDAEFEQLLEEAYTRTEEDQFIGLIVKNLENIQGDERDIIIMSVCYGFDAKKRILMNFGPINKRGGEKRLNVLFSRAKKHMAIVSSIKYHHITNEYNEGANYLRRYLQYAENVSNGNMNLARTILDGLIVNKKNVATQANSTAVLGQLKEKLMQLGYDVAEQVGQSQFKCSLAVKADVADEEYKLSILIDDEQHYSNPDLLEQYYQRPAILESFGWRTIHVFAKDWLQDPQKVLQQIIKRIKEPPAEETNAVSSAINNDTSVSPVVLYNNSPAFTDSISEPAYERLINTEGGSNKFWEAATDGMKVLMRYGRIGTKGQFLIKTFLDEERANAEKEKMINEKLANGYRKG